MDTEYCGLQQGSSSSCRTADTAPWGAAQQQKRQRCQGSSSDQAGSSTSNSLQVSEPEPQDFDSGENEEEDYYMEDDCDDDEGYDEDEYEFDEADFNQHLADKFDDLDLPPGVEATVPWLQKIAAKEEAEEPSDTDTADENIKKYKQFKQFDTVQNFSDHHYAVKSQGEPTRAWSKRIQHDWKLLEKDLPGSIYVRVAEDRMDLLRAAIIGPKGTPYHDGLFFFDVHFPPCYPSGPPLVYYHSGGLRINPNLYNCGKVCLSLLGTWRGKGCEKWNPTQSTMLQVLVSIQALILNEKPYFNEPGYEANANTPHGERNATDYNDNTFLHSCRTMLYSLRRPPEHFADLVAGHFRVHGHTILAACKYYMEGNNVGSAVPEEEEESEDISGNAAASSSSDAPKPQPNKANLLTKRTTFNASLKMLFEDLLMEFNVKGADTRKFLAEKLKKNQPAA
ncbi:putative ubiquitin-conjugating enzyme E2 38 [Phragmites australis]|uniref:putative ubiquitin-conjugating enzyme E2 38 n=1 Tax=Phragmites australis TaxID=29695 RepID=UPI002D78C6F8|nr:putative ubiquitin-conjugating enzyme E2 38 [Phragmites australis]